MGALRLEVMEQAKKLKAWERSTKGHRNQEAEVTEVATVAKEPAK